MNPYIFVFELHQMILRKTTKRWKREDVRLVEMLGTSDIEFYSHVGGKSDILFLPIV